MRERASVTASRRADGVPVVDLGLGALGLELVEDAREHRDLRGGELELVREEAQRTSHAKEAAVVGRPAAEPTAAAGCMTAVTAVTAVAVAVAVAERRAVVTTAFGATQSSVVPGVKPGVFPPRIKCRMHAVSTRRGHDD